MLSAILRSDIAVKTSIAIMNAFISLRHYLADNAVVFQRLDRIEIKQLETDERINRLFKPIVFNIFPDLKRHSSNIFKRHLQNLNNKEAIALMTRIGTNNGTIKEEASSNPELTEKVMIDQY